MNSGPVPPALASVACVSAYIGVPMCNDWTSVEIANLSNGMNTPKLLQKLSDVTPMGSFT